jgi:hypothetical protein
VRDDPLECPLGRAVLRFVGDEADHKRSIEEIVTLLDDRQLRYWGVSLMVRCAGFIIVAVVSMSSLARAECIAVRFDVPASLRASDLVFAGTLVKTENQGDRLTFRVDRIWKGRSIRQDVVVYVLGRPWVESYLFSEKDEYLIFAHMLSAEERRSEYVNPDEPTAFGIARSCGSPPPLTLSTELDKMAQSRRPRG